MVLWFIIIFLPVDLNVVCVHSTSEIMYEVLDESLQRAEMNHNITYGMSNLEQ